MKYYVLECARTRDNHKRNVAGGGAEQLMTKGDCRKTINFFAGAIYTVGGRPRNSKRRKILRSPGDGKATNKH